MDWTNIIISLAMLLAFGIGLPLAMRARKRTAPQKVAELLEHLQSMGMKVAQLPDKTDPKEMGLPRSTGQKSEGIIEIQNKHISYINIISVTSQYGVNFYLDFLVNRPNWLSGKERKKTKMAVKKDSAIKGKVADITWKGDDYLSRTLNYDYQLKDRLVQTEPDELKGGIEIYPESKHEYSRIRTTYRLPSRNWLEAVDTIAGYIKSGW